MGLSVRVAMFLCLGSIGGMSWVVQQFSVPQATVATPAGMSLAGVGSMRVPGVPNVERARQAGGQRVEWARQFRRPNALEVQAAANHAEQTAVAFMPPAPEVLSDMRTAGLPPLVYDPEMVVVSAPQAEAQMEWAPTAEAGTELTAAADGAEGASEPTSPGEAKRYRVVKGDTPGRIAQREWKSGDPRLVELLLSANPQVKQRAGRILVGEELAIPSGALAARVLVGERVPAVAVTAAAAPKTADAQWYTIQRNDSLASIAQRYLKDGRRWREIAALNSGLDPRKIVPGLRIKLPPVIRMANG